MGLASNATGRPMLPPLLAQVLGTTRHATDHEIKKAYKKMALQLHPDRHTGASDAEKAEMEIKFKELGEVCDPLPPPLRACGRRAPAAHTRAHACAQPRARALAHSCTSSRSDGSAAAPSPS